MAALARAEARPRSSATSRPAALYAGLAAIVAVYLALALAYAHFTPAWQSPDEPAHFNYVRTLADHGQLPVLQAGDYPAQLVPLGPGQRPADLAPYRYEAHQPPLYYALAAGVYKAGGGILALRAISVLLGAALLVVVFQCARLALPGRPFLWLAAAAFVAFIPMNLFISGSIDNDALADLVLSLLILACLAGWRWPVLGLLFGAALLTKVTIYLPAGILLIYWSVSLWRRTGAKVQLTRLAGAGGIALLIAGWWFVRNGFIYGWTDVLAQHRQAAVAAGQLQTNGLGSAELERFVVTSFDSFWGQFGWMSIPLPDRAYALLLVFAALVIVGWIAARPRLHGWDVLLLAWAGVLAGDLFYNLTFVQPQGRYLFPALVPIAIFCVAGFAGLFPKRWQPAAVVTLSLGLMVFSAYILRHDLIPAFNA